MIKQKVRKLALILPVLTILIISMTAYQTKEDVQVRKLRFGISFPEEQSKEALDGRVFLMISTDGSREPRFQISDSPDTQLIFGIDVDGLKPEDEAVIDERVFGYPLESISEIPPG